jgi:hypothetical protein
VFVSRASQPATVPGRWRRWVRFLDRREPGTSLALFRIAIGLVVVGAVGSVVLHGLVPSLWFDRRHGGFLAATSPNWLVGLIGGPTPSNVWALTVVSLASGILLATGLGGRLTAFVALQSYVALISLNPIGHGGDDILLGNALWLLVLARSTATLSLDCRLRTGRSVSAEPVPAWPRYLVIYQLVLVYWATGIQKVAAEWVPGGDLSALYYILQEPSWVRWDLSWLAWVYPLTQGATLVTWLFEICAPLLLLALWYRRTADRPGRLRAFFNWINHRRLFVVVGVTLHVSLLVLMNVEPFSWATLSFYFCLFRPEEWHALAHRLFGGQPASALAAAGTRWWPPVRAALVTLHLVAVTLLAIPAPPEAALSPEIWRDAQVHDEVSTWADRLSGWGLAVTPTELEEFLRAASQEYLPARNALVAPFEPYYTYCHAYQSWQMFCAPDRAPTRLHVDIEEGGVWRTVAVERDPERPWLDGWLSHHRVRPAVFAFGRGDTGYRNFAAWLAEQAAHDFPGAERVRVRYYKAATPSPEEMRAGHRPEGQFVNPVVLSLAGHARR